MEIENLRLQSEIDSIIDKIYPIGSIYMSISPTNPEETIGGAWVPWGQGRVPVGVDTDDTDFNIVEKTGGEKEHRHYNGVYSVDNQLAISNKNSLNSGKGEQVFTVNGTSGFTSKGNVNTYKYASESGSSTQPYITCYMWKRVEPFFLLEWTDSDGEHSEEVVPDYNQHAYGLKNKIDEIEDNRSGNIKNLKVSSYGIKIKDTSGLGNTYHTNNIDYSKLNVSEATDMLQTFSRALISGSDDLKTINVSGWNTENVKSMGSMFSGRNALKSLDLSSFNTSNVTRMQGMFYDCKGLTSLDLSSFNTLNVTDMSYMFSGCKRLTSLDLSSFDFLSVINSDSMFRGVSADCQILVKDQTAKNFVLSARSDLTNVQIKS